MSWSGSIRWLIDGGTGPWAVEVAHTPKPVAVSAAAATANEVILRMRTYAVHQKALLFGHLVGEREQFVWNCQPERPFGNLLVRPFGGSGGHVFRIEMTNPLAPHSDERPRRQLIHRFPRVFDGREGIPPDRAFAPFFALLLAFAGGTHGFPGDAIRSVDVLGGAFPALLMDQVKIAQGRLLVRHPLEQNAFGNDLVGGRDGIVAGITNLPGAEFVE